MTNIELLDIGDFYEKEKEFINEIGIKTFNLVNEKNTREMLFQRNFLSVILEYGKSENHARQSADLHSYLSERSSTTGISHFVILNSDSEELLGHARIHDFLNLQYRPESKKPTIIDKILGKKIVRSTVIKDDVSNIDAWVKPSKESGHILAQVYAQLISETSNSWTTEPTESIEANQAIQLAGMEIVLPPRYYDCEIKNQRTVPLSNLYLSKDLEQEIIAV